METSAATARDGNEAVFDDFCASPAIDGTDPENIRSISAKLAQRLCLPKQTAYECVNCVFAIMGGALRSGSRISIRNFGSFETKTSAPRKIFIPSQNKFVMGEAKKSVRFSSKLKF